MTSPLGTLFVVATPIGNLGDITLRAIEMLRAADGVLAEDTRRTRALLTHLEIRKPLASLHAHSKESDLDRAVERLRAGESLALVTDAGTPSVSDPGEELVRRCIAAAIPVVAIPGPSAVLCALAASGLAGDGHFRFVGFLPRDGRARRDAIALVATTDETVVLFEAPTRTDATLHDLSESMPERSVAVARELTKTHEEFVRGTLSELARSPREWRGEVTIVLGPYHHLTDAPVIDEAAIDARIRSELADGQHPKIIAERVAAWCGSGKREIYARVVALKKT